MNFVDLVSTKRGAQRAHFGAHRRTLAHTSAQLKSALFVISKSESNPQKIGRALFFDSSVLCQNEHGNISSKYMCTIEASGIYVHVCDSGTIP